MIRFRSSTPPSVIGVKSLAEDMFYDLSIPDLYSFEVFSSVQIQARG